MATLTIRDLEDGLKLKLRLRAASQNRSMEEEARQILRAALNEPAGPRSTLVARVKSRFEGLDDVNLPIEPREPIRQALQIHEPDAAYASAPTAAAGPAATRPSRKPAAGRSKR